MRKEEKTENLVKSVKEITHLKSRYRNSQMMCTIKKKGRHCISWEGGYVSPRIECFCFVYRAKESVTVKYSGEDHSIQW